VAGGDDRLLGDDARLQHLRRRPAELVAGSRPVGRRAARNACRAWAPAQVATHLARAPHGPQDRADEHDCSGADGAHDAAEIDADDRLR